MPTTTQTLAKGIPPRLHEPKTKGKPCMTKTKKQTASKSESESKDSDLEPIPVKNKARKKSSIPIVNQGMRLNR